MEPRRQIVLRVLSKARATKLARHYRIAAADVLADRRLRELEPFAVGDRPWPPEGRDDSAPPWWAADIGFRCRVRGLIGRGLRDVELQVGAKSLELVIDGSACFALDGNRILYQGSEGYTIATEEAVSSLCLILALALGDCFVLHASAVHRGGRAVAFAGDSGAGKSTLAAHAESFGCAGFRRLADDLLPFGCGAAGEVQVWPAFPQLKLGGPDQLALAARPEYPLQALFLLRPLEPDAGPAIHRLAPAEAALAVAAQTAAARLFPPALLRRHLGVAVDLARSLPVYALDYPHHRDALEQVFGLVDGVL